MHLVCTLLTEVSKRGWRTEGVGARKSFKNQRFRPLFCTIFPNAPLGEGGHISGEFFLGSFGGFVCRQPPPANPFSKPLIDEGVSHGVSRGPSGCGLRIVQEVSDGVPDTPSLNTLFVGTGKGIITKGVFSMDKSLDYLKSLPLFQKTPFSEPDFGHCGTQTPRGTLLEHPRFRGHSQGHSQGTSVKNAPVC